MKHSHLSSKRSGLWLFARGAILLAVVSVSVGCIQATPGDQSQDLPTIDGTWTGVINHTYYCESQPYTAEFTISGDDIELTGGSITEIEWLLPANLTGTLTDEGDGRYKVAFESEGVIPATFVVDTTASYAVFATDTDVPDPQSPYRQGMVGILEKNAVSDDVSYTESDVVGSWSGVTVRVDGEFNVTSSAESSGTFLEVDGIVLQGTDAEGDFSTAQGGVNPVDLSAGVYLTYWDDGPVVWGNEDERQALYFLSSDKDVMAIAFLTGLCDLDIFKDLPSQKFALWERE